MNAWRHTPTLVGAHVQLRPLEAGDRDAIVAAASDGRLWELFYTIVPGPDTIDAYLTKAFSDRDRGRALPFVVLDPKDTLIGATRFMRMHRANRRVEIGTTFYARRAQRTPINTEAKLLLLTHAFEQFDCIAVELRTDWHNKASRAAIERLGAKQDGVLRSHAVAPDGRIRDTVCYSILAHEWPGVRANLNWRLTRERDER